MSGYRGGSDDSSAPSCACRFPGAPHASARESSTVLLSLERYLDYAQRPQPSLQDCEQYAVAKRARRRRSVCIRTIRNISVNTPTTLGAVVKYFVAKCVVGWFLSRFSAISF